jgi:TRAP-type C4-dicarboxylate transport system substrate-binding protein
VSAGAAALLALSNVAGATELRLSHQWSNKDVRHKVAEIVANEVAAANVDLEIKIFGSKSLFKPREQYKPLSRGQLDMTVLPLSYAGGQQPAYNLTLMPGLVKNHDHAARLSASPFMKELEAKMATDDVMVLVHGYLAGGFVGKDKCITNPQMWPAFRPARRVRHLNRCWPVQVPQSLQWHHPRFTTRCRPVC